MSGGQSPRRSMRTGSPRCRSPRRHCHGGCWPGCRLCCQLGSRVGSGSSWDLRRERAETGHPASGIPLPPVLEAHHHIQSQPVCWTPRRCSGNTCRFYGFAVTLKWMKCTKSWVHTQSGGGGPSHLKGKSTQMDG